MSEYYSGLGKLQYSEKLQLVGLNLEDDPYLGNGFTNNLSDWPKVKYGHIFGYFIQRPGVYKQEQLLSWKQLDAYNYFTNGHVRKR